MATDVPTPAGFNDPVLVTVNLDVPIKREGGDITSVQVRKPGAGELRGLKLVDVVNVDVNAMFQLLPRITQPVIHTQELVKMDIADFLALSNEVATFLPQRAERMDYQAE